MRFPRNGNLLSPPQATAFRRLRAATCGTVCTINVSAIGVERPRLARTFVCATLSQSRFPRPPIRTVSLFTLVFTNPKGGTNGELGWRIAIDVLARGCRAGKAPSSVFNNRRTSCQRRYAGRSERPPLMADCPGLYSTGNPDRRRVKRTESDAIDRMVYVPYRRQSHPANRGARSQRLVQHAQQLPFANQRQLYPQWTAGTCP